MGLINTGLKKYSLYCLQSLSESQVVEIFYVRLRFLMKSLGEFRKKHVAPSCNQGPVVQNIVSLTSSLRRQLMKCFMILLLNTLIFFVEKMRKAFAKLLTLFQQKILAYMSY